MDNNFPILILYAQGAQRVLTNDISNGLCVCPVSVNLDNLHNAQIKMKNISLHYITEFTQLIDTLSVTVDKEITNCLNNFIHDTICSGVESKSKRSVFSFFDSSGDMRNINQIFNNNFKKIEKTENAKGRLLHTLRQQLTNERIQLKTVIKDSNAYYIIDYAHFGCIKMTLNVWSMMQLLSDEFQYSTIRNVVKLLVDPAANCHFVPLFKSCVKVRSFERANSTALNVYFYHGQPKLIAFKLALCLPKIVNDTFMISTSHNMKVYKDKALSTEVRKMRLVLLM